CSRTGPTVTLSRSTLRASPRSRWFGWTSRVTSCCSTPPRDDGNLTTYAATRVSLSRCRTVITRKHARSSTGEGESPPLVRTIDKLAKRFLGLDKYPHDVHREQLYRRPSEKRLIVRIEVDRISGMGPHYQNWS